MIKEEKLLLQQQQQQQTNESGCKVQPFPKSTCPRLKLIPSLSLARSLYTSVCLCICLSLCVYLCVCLPVKSLSLSLSIYFSLPLSLSVYLSLPLPPLSVSLIQISTQGMNMHHHFKRSLHLRSAKAPVPGATRLPRDQWTMNPPLGYPTLSHPVPNVYALPSRSGQLLHNRSRLILQHLEQIDHSYPTLSLPTNIYCGVLPSRSGQLLHNRSGLILRHLEQIDH